MFCFKVAAIFRVQIRISQKLCLLLLSPFMLNCTIHHWVSFVASLRCLHINRTIWNEKKQNNSTQMCYLWLSEGRPDLDSWVREGVNSAAFRLQDTICAKSSFSKHSLRVSPGFSFPRHFPYLNPDLSRQKLMGMMRLFTAKHYQVHRDPASTLIAWVPWTSI